jgi:hypothetical protein
MIAKVVQIANLSQEDEDVEVLYFKLDGRSSDITIFQQPD